MGNMVETPDKYLADLDPERVSEMTSHKASPCWRSPPPSQTPRPSSTPVRKSRSQRHVVVTWSLRVRRGPDAMTS